MTDRPTYPELLKGGDDMASKVYVLTTPDPAKIIISEYSCDACGVIGETLYELRYGTGQRIGSIYCRGCAEARRDELLADSP